MGETIPNIEVLWTSQFQMKMYDGEKSSYVNVISIEKGHFINALWTDLFKIGILY